MHWQQPSHKKIGLYHTAIYLCCIDMMLSSTGQEIYLEAYSYHEVPHSLLVSRFTGELLSESAA
jgi:hypothetical protein